MSIESQVKLLVADRVWIAVARLHQLFPIMESFSKREILEQLELEGLAAGVERGTLNAHLDQHCVSNRPPSSGKYRMLFEPSPGALRLFRPGDLTHPGRAQRHRPSKSVPRQEEIPEQYWPLLDWYKSWSQEAYPPGGTVNWKDDPLIRLIGSGKHIWADEHADEYVNRLREDPA